jgi:hypothetical protein
LINNFGKRMDRILKLSEAAGYECGDESISTNNSPTPISTLALLLDLAIKERDLAININSMLITQSDIEDQSYPCIFNANRRKAERYSNSLKSVRSMIEAALGNMGNLFAKLQKPLPAHFIGLPDCSKQ